MQHQGFYRKKMGVEFKLNEVRFGTPVETCGIVQHTENLKTYHIYPVCYQISAETF